MNNLLKITFVVARGLTPGLAPALPCEGDVKVAGFATVKIEKAYFYTKSPICELPDGSCKTASKAYLVKNNFVQTAHTEGSFTCAVFRNFDGGGGKKTVGWMLNTNLTSPKKKLERADLIGS